MRLTERQFRCFDPADLDQAREYLATARDAWRDISTALTRDAWIIVLLMAAFELAAHRAVSSVTLGPFALGNLKLIRVFIPAIVSYLFYELILLVIRWLETESVHRYLMHLLSPQVEEYDFDALLAPRLPALSNLVHSYSDTSATPSKSIRAIAQYILAVAVLLSVPAFDAFAFKELSSEFGIASALFWLNVAAATALVALALSVLLLWLVEERLVW